MPTQADTITTTTLTQPVDSVADSLRHEPLTVSRVLSWLPKDATPAQQDSIVQRYFKPDTIHWSNRPDTLCLPGLPSKKVEFDLATSKIYNETYFTDKPFFRPDLFGGRLGMTGEPIPYAIARDNVIVVMLLACFLVSLIGFATSRRFALKQLKEFFRKPKTSSSNDTDTTIGFRFQIFLSLQTFLLMGLVNFFYAELRVAQLFEIDNYAVIGVFSLIVLCYFVVKALLYRLCGYVFFTKQQTDLWLNDYLFLLCSEGLLLFPIVVLQTFFSMPVETTLVCAAVLVILFRILTFYKTYNIFFRQKRAYLQNILYLCTLDLVPIAALLGVLSEVANYLKVSF